MAEGTRYRMLVILLLPMIKVAVKNMLLRCTATWKTWFQRLSFSRWTFSIHSTSPLACRARLVVAVTAITVTDLLQSCVILYGLHRRTAMIRPKLQEITISKRRELCLTMVSSLCQDSGKFVKQIRHGIRIRSCLPDCISEANKIHLQFLEEISEQSHQVTTPAPEPIVESAELRTHGTDTCNLRLLCTRARMDTILPVLPTATDSTLKTHKGSECSEEKIDNSYRYFRGALHHRVHRRRIVLGGDCSLILLQLYAYNGASPECPVPHGDGWVTRENVGSTVFLVLLFGLLQLVSFGLLVVVIKRNFGLQALYQLGFVLETQVALIQGKLMLWMIIHVLLLGGAFWYVHVWLT
ncbi:hypothetical protein GQ600_24083 [Phytophthora cactorum]|nr:hypothetical protein GQ600_24083 [Phytophthora cactorum]